MAVSTSRIILITREPYPLYRIPSHRTSSICLRCKNSAIIAPSSSSSFRNGSPPETECPVPWDQQPVNEYTALSTSFPFSWAAADLHDYCTRLALVGSSFAILVGLPVAAFGIGSVADTPADAFRCGLGAASTGIIAVMLSVLRMYLGWAYVGNRLLSAIVEYEETGWYDGQMWVKTPEVLTRDRLLGSLFEFNRHLLSKASLNVILEKRTLILCVKPVLTRVKFTLIGLAISLAVCVIIFFDVENPKNIPGYTGEKVIPGVYNDEAARSFEPDAFCGEPD